MAFCVLYLVFFFLEKPKQKKGVDIFSQKEEDVQNKKKGEKKPNDDFLSRKNSPKKRKSPQKEHFEHKAARIIQSTRARAGVLGMRER